MQNDGKLVVSGGGSVFRYDSSGNVDTDFGFEGRVIVPMSLWFGVALQTNGKIPVAGSFESASDEDLVLLRFEPDGNLDTSFGTGGVVRDIDPASNLAAKVIAIDSGGRLIAATSATAGGSSVSSIAVTANGTLDPTYGTGGRVVSTFGLQSLAVEEMALQSDGKIVLIGSSRNDRAGNR